MKYIFLLILLTGCATVIQSFCERLYLCQILRMVPEWTPYRLATSTLDSFHARASISGSRLSGSFVRLFLSPHAALLICLSLECAKLSLGVTYSRLSRALLWRLKSMWFTCKLLGPAKASITSLCSLKTLVAPDLLKDTYRYPVRLLLFGIISCVYWVRNPPLGRGTPLRSDITLPRLLTKYRPSYPGMAAQISGMFMALLLAGCSTVSIPDFKAHITLPASGDGYWVNTVSEKEGRIPKKEWDIKKKRGIVLLSEDWAILRNTVLKNCLSSNCKDAVGVFDDLFKSLDTAARIANPILKK